MTAGGFSDMWHHSLMYMHDTGIMTKLEETSCDNDRSVRSHYELASCMVTLVYYRLFVADYSLVFSIFCSFLSYNYIVAEAEEVDNIRGAGLTQT